MTETITWYGHATLKLSGPRIVYIDPYDLGNSRCEAGDIVLITHEHCEHCSPADIRRVSREGTVVIAPACCAAKLGRAVRTIAPGETYAEEGVTIEAVPAYNCDKPYHPKSHGGVGYIVTLNGVRYYHAGDTDVIPEMRTIRADVAIVPVGGTTTMDAREAADAVATIRPRVAVPMHFGSVVGTSSDAEQFRALSVVPVEILPEAE